MKKILLLNGPNLNMLGKREPHIYGVVTLKDLEFNLETIAKRAEVKVLSYQSNCEGELIDQLHKADKEDYDGVIFNPAAFTHYSYALRDAVASIGIPVVEVHISNIYKREDFRQKSVIAPETIGQISGFGVVGYELALTALLDYIKRGELNV